MEKNGLLTVVAITALIAGFGSGYSVRGAQTPLAHMMQDGTMMNGAAVSEMDHAMDEMMEGLQGKTGDEFDKAFLSEMIMHHQGALDMSHAVLQSAKHEELKQFAEKIISAQSAEIEQMRQWHSAWYAR